MPRSLIEARKMDGVHGQFYNRERADPICGRLQGLVLFLTTTTIEGSGYIRTPFLFTCRRVVP